MNHIIPETNWREELERTIQTVKNGDILFVPNVIASNAAIEILSASARDVFVYVRISGWAYHPPVGVDESNCVRTAIEEAISIQNEKETHL